MRLDCHSRRPERNDQTWPAFSPLSNRRLPCLQVHRWNHQSGTLGSKGSLRFLDVLHLNWNFDGSLPQQRRRSLGQHQEVLRINGIKENRHSFGSCYRRYCWRSLQGHSWSLYSHPDQASFNNHSRHGPTSCLIQMFYKTLLSYLEFIIHES